jgi:hypothetical protein
VDTFAARIARLANNGNVLALSGFASAAYRGHAAEWLFPQEKTALHAVPVLICEAKPLKAFSLLP